MHLGIVPGMSAHSQGHSSSQSIFGTSSIPPTIVLSQKCQCKQVWAEKCDLCKTCCSTWAQGCTSQNHLLTPPHTIQITSFTLTGPPIALLSLQLTSTGVQPVLIALSSSSISDLEVAPQWFHENMPSDWVKEWNDKEEEVQKWWEAVEIEHCHAMSCSWLDTNCFESFYV